MGMILRKAKRISLAIGQINPTVGDFEGNARKICSFLEQAEKTGSDLVVFPELAVCGYPVWDLANKSGFVDRGLRAVARIANSTRNKRITAIFGFIDRSEKGSKKNHNSLAVVRGGRVVLKQAKTLLPTYDVFLEEIFFLRAKTHKTFSFNGTKVGPCICEDLWDDDYATKPGRLLKQKGAQVLVNLSASPYSDSGVGRRIEVICRKAAEYGLWVIYVNQVGGQDDLIFDGRSCVVAPNGKMTFVAPPFQEGLFYTTIDLNKKSRTLFIQRSKKTSSFVRIKEVYDALVLGLADYIRKNGFRNVVVGLSGGIDSALVAALACDALGSKFVIGAALPGPYSSKRSFEDARLMARKLGIEFRVKSIMSQYEHFMNATIAEKRKRGAPIREKRSISVAMENLQARLRGLQLMYISNDEGALLLTTGNKSELAMGYSTLYGDMCGGLSVIGDVYKTDVYRLARYRNSISPVIPLSIFSKAPSAELRPNQKDQDSLPPYSVLDRILYHYIEKNQSANEIVRTLRPKRITARTIRRVLTTVDHNEYKRRQLPPALRITEKAWFGRRMPITNEFDI